MKYIKIILLLLLVNISYAQEKKQKIKYKHADVHKFDRSIDEAAQMMVGNVVFEHSGSTLKCDSAVFYQGKNEMRAFGHVVINQADTLHMYSDYLEYDGDTKMALSFGNVRLKDSSMELTTDTVHFDRTKQIAYYPSFGTIVDGENTLTSIKGTYFTETKKLVFRHRVKIVNKEYVMNSDHLVYYTGPKTVYFYGPSTIESDANYIYCEKGFYDTENENSYFKDNSFIRYGTQTLSGDSLYYDRMRGFGSANENIEVNDSTKNLIIRGKYAEYHEKSDSTFVTGRATAINVMDRDSLFMHSDTLMMTLLPGTENRLLRAFHGVKMFKTDMQGKCDSLSYHEDIGEIRMLRNPVIWSGKNQLTSDTIIVQNNVETNQLDSLKLINNGFIISNDTIENFNQIKGKNIYGKFKENDLDKILVVGNSETLYYARNEEKELVGVNKAASSSILITLRNNDIYDITFITSPEAELSPDSMIPDNIRKLKGFVWRDKERILKKEDIYIKDNEAYKIEQDITDSEPVKNNSIKQDNKREKGKPKGRQIPIK